MANGEPITSLPNWDPIRKVLVIHRGEREQELLDAYGAGQADERADGDAGKRLDLATLNRLTAELLEQIEHVESQECAATDGAERSRKRDRQSGPRNVKP